MHASFRLMSSSFSLMRASTSRIRLACACIRAMASARHCRTAVDERSHQPRQIIGQCAGSQQPIALLDRQLNDRLVEFSLGLAQELVYIIGHHDRCRRSLPGGPGGPLSDFSQSLSLPLKPASTAT